MGAVAGKKFELTPRLLPCVGPTSGGVAQLGERLPCTQEAIGSIPFTSTKYWQRPTVLPNLRNLGAPLDRIESGKSKQFGFPL